MTYNGENPLKSYKSRYEKPLILSGLSICSGPGSESSHQDVPIGSYTVNEFYQSILV